MDQIRDRLQKARVLVVGDAMLDPVDFGAFYQQQAVTQQGADGQSIGNA